MTTDHESAFESHVVIVGVGLIGGSIAAAVRARFPECRVTGVGRNEARLLEAKHRGLLTDFVTSPQQLAGNNPLVVVCLPVNLIPQSIREFAERLSILGAGVVTDGGSVKGSIYSALQGTGPIPASFVGAHPIAGSEQAGFEHADSNLYVGKTCVVTPEGAAEINVDRVKKFWAAIGCRVLIMTASEHDRVLALTSHLPHVMASVTASCVQPDQLPLAGTGFRDTTRIAAGAADLWTGILLGNQAYVVEAMLKAESVLTELRHAVEQNDTDTVRKILHNAALLRKKLDDSSPSAAGGGLTSEASQGGGHSTC